MAKKIENTEGKTKMELTIEKLDKTYGKGTILTLDNKANDSYEVISTGSLGFDWKVLGVGGFVKGKMYELMGWESSGKSTICAHAVANCQMSGGVTLYVDGEHAVDRDYFKAIGVDTTKLLIAQPGNGEEGFNIVMDAIKTGEVDLIIIDSDSSLIPKSVMDNDVGEATIGKKARLNSDAYPKIKNLLVESNVCVIVISQYREKIGMMFGNPTTTQGGHALKYYSDCRIEISRSLAKDGDDVYGNLTKVKTVKNKTFSPYRKCQFDIIYGKGIDRVSELFDYAVDEGIIKRAGSWYSYKETKLGQGDGAKTILGDNPELYDEIEKELLSIIMKENNTEDEL
jgi:recombination protein RecA